MSLPKKTGERYSKILFLQLPCVYNYFKIKKEKNLKQHTWDSEGCPTSCRISVSSEQRLYNLPECRS